MLNKDEVKEKVKQIEGSVKDKIGEVTNTPRLEAEGEAERLEGKVQQRKQAKDSANPVRS